MTVVILGGTGMLGSMLVRVLNELPVPVYASFHDGSKERPKADSVHWFMFNAGGRLPPSIESGLGPGDWIVNAIGLIPHRGLGRRRDAIQVNASFPYELIRYTERRVRVLQIATDCVFLGNKGAYVEDDPHDAVTVYGKTKSLGEVDAPGFHHLRCSIVGPELNNKLSLLEWVLSHDPDSEIMGYSNHLWNGITTLAFAKIVEHVIADDVGLPRVQHIVPKHPVSKRALVQAIATHYGLGARVIPCETPGGVRDMTLSTENGALNDRLWRGAGYDGPPGMDELIQETAAFDRRGTRVSA